MRSPSTAASSKWVSSVTSGFLWPSITRGPTSAASTRQYFRTLLFKSDSILFCESLARVGTHGFLLLLKHGYLTWHEKRHASLCDASPKLLESRFPVITTPC